MNEFVLKFFGFWVSGNEKLIGVRPGLHAPVHPGLLCVLGILLAAGVAWLYRREQGEWTAARRMAATTCRILLLATVLLILVQPVLAITTSASVSDSLAVLIDTSSSMQIADGRDQPEDRLRAAIALGTVDARGGLHQTLPPGQAPAPARIDVVKAALRNPQLQLPEQLRRNFQLSLFTFDRQVADVPLPPSHEAPQVAWVDALQAHGPATALGDAIQRVLIAQRGEALGGILIITDGASNTGLPLRSAANFARDEQVPLYIYGVGITSPRDVQVSATLAPDVAFVRNELPVTVRIRAEGYRGQQAKVVLKLDGTVVASTDVALDGERVVSMSFTPDQTGSFTLQASIAPLPGEVVTDNNTSPPRRLRVVDTRIKVLHIEQSPRWEFKYLQAMMLRDPRIDYHCWLLDADTGGAPATAAASPSLETGFPTLKDLFTYDLIILGDVDPHRLPAGAMDQMNTFVAKEGGGFIMMAGPRAAPLAYARTPIERMLPVEFDAMIPLSGDGEKPIHLELTPAGNANPMLRLADKEPDNLQRWEHLAPLYWTARVSGPKPAAEVLAVDPDPGKGTRLGKMPVIAVQPYGAGSVLYVGTDNTWRWRRNDDLEVFDKVWSQIVEHMALTHVLGSAGSTQLSLDRVVYAPGDRAVVFGRFYRPGDFEPLTQPRVEAYYTPQGQAGNRQACVLLALPDQPGIYRGEFMAPTQGNYRLATDLAPQASVDFAVADTQIEHGEAALNEAGLRDLAQRTGGAFVREEDLYRLPELIRHTSKPILYTREVDVWSSAWFFLIPLALAGTEWWIRKRALLK